MSGDGPRCLAAGTRPRVSRDDVSTFGTLVEQTSHQCSNSKIPLSCLRDSGLKSQKVRPPNSWMVNRFIGLSLLMPVGGSIPTMGL
jgi:hypothetical protein